MKCEIPAFESVSSREPAPIQKPRATDRTLGMRSEITRSPESSSDRTYFCTRSLSLAGSAGRPGHLMQRRDQLAGASRRRSTSEPGLRVGSSRRPPEPSSDAERIPVGVAHDREGDVRADLRLHHRRARAGEALDLRLAVVGGEIEVDRIRRGPGLFAALKE